MAKCMGITYMTKALFKTLVLNYKFIILLLTNIFNKEPLTCDHFLELDWDTCEGSDGYCTLELQGSGVDAEVFDFTGRY